MKGKVERYGWLRSLWPWCGPWCCVYAAAGMGGGGGGGGVKGGVPRTRCSTGVRLWGCLFGVLLSCMSVLPVGALYDRGRVRCCQGGIFTNTTADAGWGDSRLRGNDGRVRET